MLLILKGVLKEELENAKMRYDFFRDALNKLPAGTLVKKEIRDHSYYYLMFKKDKKVKFIYKGKNVSGEEIQKYADAKRLRAQYIHDLSDLNKEIALLKRVLRAKEFRSGS